jgi:uncharacterized protein YndB with AHSA1/START domain
MLRIGGFQVFSKNLQPTVRLSVLFKSIVMNEQAQQLNISKRFATTRQNLFKAWTEEEQLKKWWKPMNKALQHVENDIREGGRIVYTFNDNLNIHGEYKQAQEQERLVYSWIWDLPEDSHHKGEYLLTVTFKGDEQECELEVLQQNFKSEHSIQPHHEGWEKALQDLKNYLEGSK